MSGKGSKIKRRRRWWYSDDKLKYLHLLAHELSLELPGRVGEETKKEVDAAATQIKKLQDLLAIRETEIEKLRRETYNLECDLGRF